MLVRGSFGSSLIGVFLFVLMFFNFSDAGAESANVEVRPEGTGVIMPDTINGLQAMVAAAVPLTFVFSAELDFELGSAFLGFRLHSPDASISTIVHIGNERFDAWRLGLNLGIIQGMFITHEWDGILPDTFLTGGAALGPAMPFGPNSLTDIVSHTIVFPHNTSGVYCIDSTFIAPAGQWLFANGANVSPAWGASVGGYPDGGYCISVFETCCDIPGDADGVFEVNISDVAFLVKYIFQGGAAPPCLMEADADNSGEIDVGDAIYILRYIFKSGEAPVCGFIAN